MQVYGPHVQEFEVPDRSPESGIRAARRFDEWPSAAAVRWRAPQPQSRPLASLRDQRRPARWLRPQTAREYRWPSRPATVGLALQLQAFALGRAQRGRFA